MRPPKSYGASHPMVVARTGDPARGEWAPWEDRSKATKRKNKRRNPRDVGHPRDEGPRNK